MNLRRKGWDFPMYPWVTDTTFPAKDCCTQSGSRRTGNVSTALLQSHKNYFHPPPRLYKLLVFRLQCVERRERCVPLDLALVMVTSLHRRRGNTETWQPSNTFLQSQHPTTAQCPEVCTGSPLIPSHSESTPLLPSALPTQWHRSAAPIYVLWSQTDGEKGVTLSPAQSAYWLVSQQPWTWRQCQKINAPRCWTMV